MPVVAAMWGWFVSLFASSITAVATWFMGRFAFETAMRYTLITGFLVAASSLFLALTVAIKASIIGARVAMPQSLGMVTYFLPASISQIFGFVVTLRVSASLYRWSVSVMSAYLPTNPRHGLLLGV